MSLKKGDIFFLKKRLSIHIPILIGLNLIPYIIKN
jgi:hypothetical protein